MVEAYTRILSAPFEDKYEERWEDEPFDRAVDDFKAKAQEIGFADPFELLSRFKIDSYETIRAQLKKGPPACFRPGWRSPLLGKYIDPADVISRCKHVSGPEFTGGYRVVVFEFWASWCDPCVQVGPELSDMAEEFAGRMAFIGINNESIFGDTKEPDLGLLQRFLEENGDDFRHTTYVDNADGYAKEIVYRPSGYRGIPCVIMLVDGVVHYVGSPQESFRPTLEQVLHTLESGMVLE